MNLALLLLLSITLTQIVSWVGKSALQQIAFNLYSRLFLGGLAKKQQNLRKQVLEDKAELSRTSSQDEFAKWAKLKRKLDKGLSELEKISAGLNSSKTGFGVKFTSLIWLLTTGSQLVLAWWYRKRPVFWLPDGWVPGPVAWILSFPSAPSGSVSSAAWGAVCKRVLQTGEEIVKQLLHSPHAPATSATKPASTTTTQKDAGAETMSIEHDKLD